MKHMSKLPVSRDVEERNEAFSQNVAEQHSIQHIGSSLDDLVKTTLGVLSNLERDPNADASEAVDAVANALDRVAVS